MDCSGAHRSLGYHNSRVKSTRLDSWTADLVEIMDNIGNHFANKYWEGDFPSHVTRLSNKSSLEDRQRFVNEKYMRKRYVSDRDDTPPVKLYL